MDIYMSWFLGDMTKPNDFKKGTQITFSNKDRGGQVSAQITQTHGGIHEVWFHGDPTWMEKYENNKR